MTELSLAHAAPLSRALRDLKSVTDARGEDSVADRLFAAAWSALVSGADPVEVALAVTARALAATRLGAIDDGVLREAGLDDAGIARMRARALAAVLPLCPPALHASLRAAVAAPPFAAVAEAPLPRFVERLRRQPRAGATAPGKPRVIMFPPESHAGHCLAVAVLGVLLAPPEAARDTVFLAGLAHHLHNAVLPDSGFAGETLLGDALDGVLFRLREAGLAQLPPPLAGQCRDALALCATAETPEGRGFNAADVLDRVEQVLHHARESAFSARDALEELELVHAGPLQRFHHEVLAAAGMGA